MKPLAFDTETSLIRPALLAPPMTCLTWARPGLPAKIAHVHEAKPVLRSWLIDPNVLLVGHFVAYDCAVICAEFPELVPLVFAAYRANRVTCTKKRQQLLDIAGGVYRGRVGEKGRWVTHNYALEDLSKRLLGKPMEKDAWRLIYATFRDVPLSGWVEHAKGLKDAAAAQLQALLESGNEGEFEDDVRRMRALIAAPPEGCIEYPLLDAVNTLGVFEAQEKHVAYLGDQFRQSYADFVLYLSSVWGLRTYGPGVAVLKAELEQAHAEIAAELTALGLVREDGTRNMRAVKDVMIATCRENKLPLRRTDAHEKCELGDACEEHVCLDSDACEAVLLADPNSDLADYAEFVSLGKMISNDVKMLESGTVYPVHTRYDLAETGRTTSSKPNIQNLNTGRIKNRNSTAQRLRPNVRQAFIPRPGKVFAQSDFPQLELYTLAQCCYSWLGFSKLGDALNAGLDPHLAMAAKIVGCTYDEASANKTREDVDHARQIGKVFNFGKPGGLGAAKLVLWARKTYGVVLTKAQVEGYTAQWYEAFPEMRAYFARVNAMFGDGVERASVETLFTHRHRGGASYCAACNNGFQALGVDCAKSALTLVAEAQYCDRASPLYGGRTVAFVHDEIIAEVDDGPGASDAALELGRLMMVGANRYLPNVPIVAAKMEPALMRVWSKEAKQIWLDGKLVPWTPSLS